MWKSNLECIVHYAGMGIFRLPFFQKLSDIQIQKYISFRGKI